MKTQLPIDADVHFKYECTSCGDEYWISKKEACTSGFKIVCFCGKVIHIQTLRGIKIIYQQSNIKVVDNKPVLSPGPSPVLEAYKTIRNLGYANKNLHDYLSRCYEDGIKTKTDLVKQFLSEQ